MRIISNQNKVVTISGDALYVDDAMPEYVKAEADATIAKTQTHGTLGRTIRFIACSDAHNDGSGKASSAATTQLIMEGNRHCGQAIQYIANRLGIDFIAFLGDATWAGVQAGIYTQGELIADIMQFNSFVGDGFRGARQVRCVGNHDQFITQTDSKRLGNIGAYNYFGRYCFGEKQNPNGYGYFDHPEVSLRVIYLNTSDITSDIQSVSGTKLNISAEQVSWMQNVLSDLASKSGWKCLILSHAPLDLIKYGGNPVSNLLLPYADSVRFLANVHGHVHCYSYGYMNEKIRRFTIPNCCFADNNHYSGRAEYADWTDSVTYNKIANTGDDTAFSLVAIDLDSNMCYVDNYGAGIDREFSCDYYSVQNLFNKNDPDMLDTGRFNSSHVAVAYQAGQLVTGYIPCTNDALFNVSTDYANNKNGYTGQICLYDGSKTYKQTAVFSSTNWTWSADKKTGTLTIDHGWASADVAYIRFCLAYTDIDNITITES